MQTGMHLPSELPRVLCCALTKRNYCLSLVGGRGPNKITSGNVKEIIPVYFQSDFSTY